MGDADGDGRERRLYAILLEHLEAAERYWAPGRAELLARDPEFAADLKEFLETWDWLERLTAPLRRALCNARVADVKATRKARAADPG